MEFGFKQNGPRKDTKKNPSQENILVTLAEILEERDLVDTR